MSSGAADTAVLFEDVSKFYGEVLGVNRIDLAIGPGITSLVGPNGYGKTTLMNLANRHGRANPQIGRHVRQSRSANVDPGPQPPSGRRFDRQTKAGLDVE